ncbi:MAG: PAS domain S-box protein [Rhodothermaceae bacterium]|nr:PAS domain S-box protein [Rhodothermaceae bacterium]
MGSDTTNSKKIRTRFEPSLNFYSQVIDSLQDYSIFTLDTDTKINSWNSGSEKILGYTRDEVIGQHFDIIFTEEDKRDNIPQNEIDVSKSEGRASDNRWHVRKKPLSSTSGNLNNSTHIRKAYLQSFRTTSEAR